jgi:hypothetical protein
VSTLDLFGHGFVLLRFSQDVNVAPIEHAALDLRVPLKTTDIADRGIGILYERKLVLVRPDGHVAWRADRLPDDCRALLNTVRGARVIRP